jgi:hypothetical protein
MASSKGLLGMWYTKGNFQAYQGVSCVQVILQSKQDMFFEELATPKRTTYSYGEAVNELWESLARIPIPNLDDDNDEWKITFITRHEPSRCPDYLANAEEIDSTLASRLLPVLRDKLVQKEETELN